MGKRNLEKKEVGKSIYRWNLPIKIVNGKISIFRFIGENARPQQTRFVSSNCYDTQPLFHFFFSSGSGSFGPESIARPR